MNYFQLRFTLVSILFLLLFSSCKKYQYLSVVGDVYNEKIMENQIETDSLIINYSFNGPDCPVKITVYNKLNQPIYVDWSKSSVILGGQRFSYWTDATSIKMNTESTEIKWNRIVSTASSNTNGVMVRNERISFIPPNSNVIYSPISIKSSWIELDPSYGKKGDVPCNYESMNGLFYYYAKENTPFEFRSFITLSTNEQFTNPRFFDSNFWVNEIMITKAGPNELLNFMPSQFYNSKPTGFGGFIGGVVLSAAIVLAIMTAN
jgi:hypothetical protein